MIRNVTILILALALSSCQTKEPYYKEEISPGGLPYSLINMPENSRISILVAWPTNWAFNDAVNQAVPVIGAELILAGGAEGYPAGKVVELFSDMSSEGYLSPGSNHIIGTLHYSPEYQEQTLEVANAHLLNPELDEQWLERIRNKLAQQVAEIQANPQVKGFEAVRWSVFGDQPVRYAFTFEEDNLIESARQSEVADWAQSVFTKAGVEVAIAGDLDAQSAGVAVDALFAGLPAGESIAKKTSNADFSSKRILFHSPEAKTSTLSFVGPLPAYSEGFEFEDILLMERLGAGFKSVLFETVRSELRASYTYQALSTSLGDQRILLLTGEVETDKLAEAERLIKEAYDQFLSDPQVDELANSKQVHREALQESIKDTGSNATVALMSKLTELDPSRALTLEAELDAVTEQSLKQRASTAYPRADDLIVLVTSPDSNALPDACVIDSPKQVLDCD